MIDSMKVKGQISTYPKEKTAKRIQRREQPSAIIGKRVTMAVNQSYSLRAELLSTNVIKSKNFCISFNCCQTSVFYAMHVHIQGWNGLKFCPYRI